MDEAVRIVGAGATNLISEADLRKKLGRGTPLRVKLGIDPTASDIHLGFAVVLRKLRQFQDLGHTAVLILGDFTAQVGDPTGRSAARPRLAPEQIEANLATYQAQAGLILRPDRLEVRRNSEWLGALGADGLLGLAGRATVAQMLERDDFSKRYAAGQPISVMELLYPLLQGYDSVAVESDVELGGTDQKFNLLLAREVQRAYGLEPQSILTMPILPGIDGVQKMSKSLGNYVGVEDPPEEMYGKLMSISDKLMLRYYELLSTQPAAHLLAVERGDLAPMEAKKALAAELVGRFHGPAAAEMAARFFEERFQRRSAYEPTPIEVRTPTDEVWICQLIKEVGFAPSTSAARRLVAQGAVRVDGQPVDVDFRFRRGVNRLLEVGRRRLAAVTLVVPEGGASP